MFDRALVELLISIPSIYQRNIIKYLQEQNLKLTQLIRDEITHDKINYFVFFIKFTLIMSKQTPDSSEESQLIYINSHRYMVDIDNLSIIFN